VFSASKRPETENVGCAYSEYLPREDFGKMFFSKMFLSRLLFGLGAGVEGIGLLHTLSQCSINDVEIIRVGTALFLCDRLSDLAIPSPSIFKYTVDTKT
jgi:hypothetical protein